MSVSINVNKKNIRQFLDNGNFKQFIIPEYQRPYAWTREQVEILFEDIWEFSLNSGGPDREDGTYFLGSVVFYENQGQYEIIDGQQRTTSLFLLLRSIYTKLKSLDADNIQVNKCIKDIEPLIWKTDRRTGEAIYSDILLVSKVINNNGNEILRKILETGKVGENACDNYSKNYEIFGELIDKYSLGNQNMICDFVYTLLNQVILLPITTDTQDTALTIFSTLNNRGLPLSDADIFKSDIYNNLPDKDKEAFILNWQELEESCKDTSESIQELFYYYMFYLRALENDKQVTTIGLRKYYSQDKSRLLKGNILDELRKILNIWKVVNNHIDVDESWASNKDIKKILNILNSYPNEFWKYPVVIFYLKHSSDSQFEKRFLLFLRKLSVELLNKYLERPTVNAVKADILKLNVEIVNSIKPKFDFKDVDTRVVHSEMKNPNRATVKMILKLLAYEEQDELLPSNWEIEHILPVRYQNNYFLNENHKTIKEKIEHIGNKLPIEKKLNIIAGNGYFLKKKEKYSKSNIKLVREFSNIDCVDWKIDDIIERDVRITDKVRSIFKRWRSDYTKS